MQEDKSNKPPSTDSIEIPKPKIYKDKKFSTSEAIKYGFNFFKGNVVVFLKLALVLIVINIMTGKLSELFSQGIIRNLWMLLSWIISVMVQLGFTKIIIDLHDGKPLNFTHFYSLSHLMFRFLGATILYGLIVTAGFVLLIIPGIIWAIKFQFYSFLIVDKGLGVIDSLKKSSTMTEGIRMDLFIFGLALVAVNVLGALAFGIGLLVSVPTSVMATVYVYRKLLSQTP